MLLQASSPELFPALLTWAIWHVGEQHVAHPACVRRLCIGA